MRLSVCVIGRNEEENLLSLIRSLASLDKLDWRPKVETLYIDSASVDRSVEIAKTYFDRVLVLEESKYICASAGRYVGTLVAQGDWMLYLDGDMELCEEFLPVIEAAIRSKETKKGFIGEYQYVYDNGIKRSNALGSKRGIVSHFGGAALLRRDAVVRAGNWNPSIFSNEEIDLYTRMQGIGYEVEFEPVPMVIHHTEWVPKIRQAVGGFIPLSKGFYGFGQVIASRLRAGSLRNLLRFFPFPFVFWATIIAGGALLFCQKFIPGLLVLCFGILYLSRAKGLRFVIVYSGAFLQAALGWPYYNGNYSPTIAASWPATKTKLREGKW